MTRTRPNQPWKDGGGGGGGGGGEEEEEEASSACPPWFMQHSGRTGEKEKEIGKN